MHILGKLYQDLAVLFASNIPLIIILVAKFFFNKKFSTKYFLIFLILTIIITIAEFVYFPSEFDEFYELTLFERLNSHLAELLCLAGQFFTKFFIYAFPIFFIVSLVSFIKTKDKNIIKKFFISLLIILPFVFIHYPFFIFPLIKKNNYENNKNACKYIADKSILPPVKAMYAYLAAMDIEFDYTSKKSQINTEDANNLIEDFIKYKTISNQLVGYSYPEVIFLTSAKRFDDALTFLGKIEERTKQIDPYRVKIYIAKKEYKKALDYANKINYKYDSIKYLDYAKIYTGLNQFDKAFWALEQFKQAPKNRPMDAVYSSARIYINYKAGNYELAQQEFVEFKEKYRYRDKDKYTFEDFLQEIDF